MKNAPIPHPSTEDLSLRHERVLDAMRPEAVAKQHARGQLTARERIALLLDEGEELWESGALAVPADDSLTAPADGLVVGIGHVQGRRSMIVSCDYTSLGGSLGITSHAKLTRAMYLAERHRLPVFALVEGGGARAQEYRSLPSLRPAAAFGTMARLSGVVPLVGLALGRAFAGHAILLGECDTVIATETAALGIAGPPLVKASTGQDLTPEQIGAAWMHAESGGVECLVKDDVAAIAAAREYARYFTRRFVAGEGSEATAHDALREIAARPGPVDVHRVSALVADPGSMLELRAAWSRQTTTALARIGGHTVGITAVGPTGDADSAVLSRDDCDKIARFASLCDAFAIPRLDVIGSVRAAADTDGPDTALFRHASRLIRTDDARAAIVCLVGRLDGVAQLLLGRFGDFLSGPTHVMWPGASLRGLGASPESGAFRVAEQYATDDVIDPGSTRELAVRAIDVARESPRGDPHHVAVW